MLRDLAAPGAELGFGEVPFRKDQVMHLQADIARLTKATGWVPRWSLREGLAETVRDIVNETVEDIATFAARICRHALCMVHQRSD